MNQFLILHEGFEKPTPDVMATWQKWLESIADRQVDRGGLRDGLEISHLGTAALPLGKESLTGNTIIEADDLEAARI